MENSNHMEKMYFRTRVPKILEALKSKEYDPYFFENKPDAAHFIVQQIRPDETVGIGGSITLRKELRIVEGIRKKGNTVFDHWEDGGSPARRLELKRIHRQVDVFLSGINAITWDGIMVNLDGGGNRVASLCSGPKRVVAVTGFNKFVDSTDDAIRRTRNRAAVMNVIRKEEKNPCVETGACIDCQSKRRMCAALLILLKKPNDIDDFKIVLVNESMGF